MGFKSTIHQGGGGGGTVNLAGGLGISLDTITNPGTTTINNTGTIVQPTVTAEASALGIKLQTSPVDAVGHAAPAYAGYGFFIGSNATADPGHDVGGGNFYIFGGAAYSNVGANLTVAIGADIRAVGGVVSSDGYALGGGIGITGGQIPDYANGGIGGHVSIYAGNGNAHAAGGGVTLGVGQGTIDGGFYVNNLRTTDPHVLGQSWWQSTALQGVILSQSQG